VLDRDAIRAGILAVLDAPPAVLADDDDLVDVGLDSLGVMALVAQWQARGAAVAFEDLVEVEPTIAAWARVLAH
jgi:aryl carrier-like protein